MLVILPIEPLTERYSEQWYRKFPEYLKAVDPDIRVIDGIPLLNNEIKTGTFLDINSTANYKFTQLQELSRMFYNKEIKDGTIIFVMDVEFWGIEVIRLLASMNRVKVHLTGFLHAASYTKEDAFSIAKSYQQYTEIGWIAAFDKIFVGSLYHKNVIISRRLRNLRINHLADKIIVTKNPIFLSEYKHNSLEKENNVLLTNRFDREKRPAETLKLFERLKYRFPDYRFKVCTSRKQLRGHPDDMDLALTLENEGLIEILEDLSKEEYHLELEKAKLMVSHSIEENYGYCIAEAIIYNCIPLLRNNASHPEFVDSNLLFDSEDEAFDKAVNVLTNYQSYTCDLDISGMDNIITELKEFRITGKE